MPVHTVPIRRFTRFTGSCCSPVRAVRTIRQFQRFTQFKGLCGSMLRLHRVGFRVSAVRVVCTVCAVHVVRAVRAVRAVRTVRAVCTVQPLRKAVRTFHCSAVGGGLPGSYGSGSAFRWVLAWRPSCKGLGGLQGLLEVVESDLGKSLANENMNHDQ